MTMDKITRRRFIGATAATATAFTIVPRHVLGGQGYTSPSEQVTTALVGCGKRGASGLGCVGKHKMIAWCDVDVKHMKGAPDNATYYTDFRRLLERKDLDVVAIATPPHWHALVCIAAAQAGKDIFCEKPMTKFIAEGRAVADAVKRYGVVFQIGTFGRFKERDNAQSTETHKIMKHGLLKDASKLIQKANVPMRLGKTTWKAEPIPENLDYDLWLGPAPFKPYHTHRVHYSNRFYWDYEGGDLANFGHHRVDPFQWKFAKDDTSPVEIEPNGPWPQHPDAVGSWAWVELKYADGLRFVLETGKWGKKYDRGGGSNKVSAKDLDEGAREKLAQLPDPPKLVNFGEAVRTRQQAGGHAEASHRAATVLHLSNIALRLGRKLRYDPVKERFIGDDQANRFIDIPMRAPWHL